MVKKFGTLNILVNNAACLVQAESLEQLDDANLAATFQTNIYGYIHMARAALPHMQRGDCIINTGSAVGISGCPYSMDYAASKGAVHAFTQSLALNVAERGIRVNAVAPGPVWTALTPGNSSEDDFANFGADTALGRVAQPEDIAPAYVFWRPRLRQLHHRAGDASFSQLRLHPLPGLRCVDQQTVVQKEELSALINTYFQRENNLNSSIYKRQQLFFYEPFADNPCSTKRSPSVGTVTVWPCWLRNSLAKACAACGSPCTT
nr:SDR family oxidoreductase [Comamonas jiangduensis]